MSTKVQSCHCKRQQTKKEVSRKTTTSSLGSVLPGILIALLPKCHFCLLAYSSAITLCSGTKIYNHSPGWTSYISIGLALITLFLILVNYKGIRTLLAATLVISGCLLISYSELKTGEIVFYYWGTFCLLFGVWVNGSFYYFFRRFILKKRQRLTSSVIEVD